MRQKFPSLFVVVLVLFAVVVAAALVLNKNDEDGGIACTMEAKLCPDGSYVGRTGPNCEFSKCPSEGGSAMGMIAGKVSIGPLCPVEPCPGPTPDPYSSRQVVMQAQGKAAIYLPLNSDGTFQGEVPAGTYSVTITDCQFMGCRYGLPKTVVMEANKTTSVEIDIDTGIR